MTIDKELEIMATPGILVILVHLICVSEILLRLKTKQNTTKQKTLKLK